MALSLVDVGTTANDGTGDPLRTAFQTVNTALTAVNNAVVVGTGTTTFKDDSGTYGVAVASNGNVTFTNAGGTTGAMWDVSSSGFIIGGTSAGAALHVKGADPRIRVEGSATAGLYIIPSNNPSLSWTFRAATSGDFEFFDVSTARLTLKAGGVVSITGDTFNVATQKTPASAAATGVKGDIAHDASYIYVCTATNTWKRAAIATW